MSRGQLLDALARHGVMLNVHAETLLAHPVFDDTTIERIRLLDRSVDELGLTHGATMPEVLTAAHGQGLGPCPAVTGPYLRLAWLDQRSSTDSVMSAGRSPDGALTVASVALSDDADFPRGFYLRVVEGRPWLRGFRCDDDHVFAPEARFAFRQLDEVARGHLHAARKITTSRASSSPIDRA
ncbi:hypothetical protein ACFQZV_02325 [Microbacterium koreense]|uniref:Uncharacterized protein n=1 Tax=Microbacterium koreense TaxID=323761 RepID=A0ABW2ZNH1_9MICO